jgi:hypothetical protein
MKENMATTTDIASKAAKFREMAKDKALPQDVRNAYLDKANKLEEATMKPTMAKGGAMMPQRGSRTAKHKETKMMGGGYAMKEPMMAKGGMPMVEKGGMKVPAFAADGKGKMAKGGVVKGGKPAIALIIGVGKPAAKPMAKPAAKSMAKKK